MADFLRGTPERIERIQKFDPQRRGAYDQLLQLGLSGLGGGQAEFGPIAEREMQRFKTDIVPALAERFTGSLASTGFSRALGRSAGDLSTRLAALGSQQALTRQGQMMQMLQMGLTPQQEMVQYEGREGALGPLSQYASKYLPMLGGIAGTAIGGPAGGAIGTGGGALISLLLSLLGGGSSQGAPPGATPGGAPGSVSYSQPRF